jgi:cell pole-organizing protein PopZ
MTEGKTTQEPTMEEILASIRRIISEDGADKAAAPAEEAVPNGSAVEPVAAPADDDEDDLVLTDMVVGDDTVVPLEAESAAPTPIPEPIAEPAIEPVAEPEAEPDLVLEQMDSEPKPEPVVMPVPPVPEPPRAAEPAPPPTPPSTPTPPSPPPSRETNPEPDAMETELVSPDVAAASAASMAQLVARKAQQAADQHGGDGLLVETLVRQAVEPMLRDWLDIHLQGIVEKLVRREVERISRRAELG